MKLKYVELCGFRGYKGQLRVDFGSGFTVITGRNGVGKSTIFDAIEYAVTGAIDKYRIERAAKESISDYIWWRGSGTAPEYFVKVCLSDGANQSFVITRTRDKGSDKTSAQIEAALCNSPRPEEALRQICRTAIIRDELIAALSLDLTETERFDFVRTALGAFESAEFTQKAKAVISAAEANVQQAQRRYDEERLQLNTELTQLSQARDAASKTGDVAAALSLLESVIGASVAELSERIAKARETLANRRSRLTASGEAVREAYDLARQRAELEGNAHRQSRASAERAVQEQQILNVAARTRVSEAEAAVTKEQELDEMAAALASLVASGERIGLVDSHCPLCAAERSPAQFLEGINHARARAAQLGAGIIAAQKRLDTATRDAQNASDSLVQAESILRQILEKESAFHSRAASHTQRLRSMNIDETNAFKPDAIEQTLSDERNRLITLEQAILTLEASRAIGLVTSVESRVAASRARCAEAELALSRTTAAMSSARTLEHAVLRTSAEIVDERLALISPLLNELYTRLRPHADWRSIEYSIRGDVRRFLSLRVGDGLNPQFVFSSGQRRAAGLAFLLSVYLARAWCKWQTLLLDDPVQHVDDFRALHLVEVLAALRTERRQIVCAVEDADLADLLCRRLGSVHDELGVRYELGHTPDGSTGVLSSSDILPMATGVLQRGYEAKAV